MIIYLYIFHETSLLTLEIICLVSTLYIIIYLTSLHYFLIYYVVFNVGYRQYQTKYRSKLYYQSPVIYFVIQSISACQFQYVNFSMSISACQFQHVNFSMSISACQFQYVSSTAILICGTCLINSLVCTNSVLLH